MSTDRTDLEEEVPAPKVGPPWSHVAVRPQSVGDGEITGRPVTLERRAAESDVTEIRSWLAARDQDSWSARRATSAQPLEVIPDAGQTCDVLHTGDNSDVSQDTWSGDSDVDQELGEDADSVAGVSERRIWSTSVIRTYVNGVIAHVIDTFSGGLLIERKPPGDPVHLQDGLKTGAPDPDNNIGLQTTEECFVGENHPDVKESSIHNSASVAETFDRRTLDITEPVLGSVSTQCSHAFTDVFDRDASAERSSGEYVNGRTLGSTVDAGVLTDSEAWDSEACETTSLDSLPPCGSHTTVECTDSRHTRRLHGALRDGAIPQTDLIISSSIVGAGYCGGEGRQLTTRELPASDSGDNVQQIRRLYSRGAGAEACIAVEDDADDDDGTDDNGGHAALVIAERVWQRSFYEHQWEFHYPAAGDGGNRSSNSSSSSSNFSVSSDKRAGAREVRIGSGDAAAYRIQTSASDEVSGGDGRGWQEPSDSVAAAELSDDVFLASSGRRNGSLTASEDSSRRPDNNDRADNNCTDTYDNTVSAYADSNRHSDIIVKSASSAFSDSGSEAWSERVGDIRGEGRCDRPESESSDGETSAICVESITTSPDGDLPDLYEEIVSDYCVACGVSDVSDSAPSSPEVNWNRASDDEAKVVRFVQSPECIDVPQVLYRSYSDAAIALLASGPMEPLIETERDENNGDGASSSSEDEEQHPAARFVKSDQDVSSIAKSDVRATPARPRRPVLIQALSIPRSNAETAADQQQGLFRSDGGFIALKRRVPVVLTQLTSLSPTEPGGDSPLLKRSPSSPGPRAKTVTSVADHDLAMATGLRQANNTNLVRVGSERLATRPMTVDTRSCQTLDTRGCATLDARGCGASSPMARLRPRLPTGMSRTRTVSDQDRHVDDLIGVLNSLGTTNFVRKYGRRAHQSSPGSSSPTLSAPSSCHSPVVTSPLCQSDAPVITLSRMRNIRMKLEDVKESQENGGKPTSENSGGGSSRPVQYARKSKSLDDTLSSYSMRSDTDATDDGPSVAVESPNTHRSHHMSTLSENDNLVPIPDVSVTGPQKDVDATPTRDASRTSHGNTTLTAKPSFEGYSPPTDVRTRLGYGHVDIECDDASLCTSDDVDDDGNRRYAKDNSLETEDEGVGSTDADVQYYKDAYTAVTSRAPLDTRGTSASGTSTSSPWDKLDGGEDMQKRVKPTGAESGHSSGTGGKSVNGRFLTHPPMVRERMSPREGGSVDSNGLGSLRNSSDPPLRTAELQSEASAVSLDSHIGASDTTEDPSYRDVVMGVTSETTDMERLERKNSKTLKQKSKSDPSGEKQKDSSPVDLPMVINAHAHSTPFLAKRIDEQKDLSKISKDQKDAPISKSDTVLASAKLTGSGIENFNVSLRREMLRDSKGSTTDEESSGRETMAHSPSAGPKQTRRPSKKRQRSGAADKSSPKDDKSKSNKQTTPESNSPSPRTLSRKTKATRSITAPEISAPKSQDKALQRSPSSNTSSAEPRNKTKLADIRSTLTLPVTSKENALMRNRSTGSFFAGKAERLRSMPGARPKDLPQARGALGGRQTRPNIHDHFDQQSEKSKLSAPSGLLRERRWTSVGTPSLEYSQSDLNLFGGIVGDKNKRELIVQELFTTERQYVETLKMLVEKFMIPMKTQGILDSNLVDDMFYKVNEIYMHHATLLAFMEVALQNWNTTATIGDIIYKNFSKQTVIESYISFIENFARAEKVLDDMSTKSSFQKFVELCERETKTKLPLKAQIVKPAQRIPRYELLLKRLLVNTPRDHPDYEQLTKAETAVHGLALRINSVKESKHEEDLQETLKKLELLLITDLVATDRIYLRHDTVQVVNRKDPCCIWLFSDLVVLSSIKRKSGTVNKRSTLMLQAPAGNDFVENVKHKMWLKISLDNLEVVKSTDMKTKREFVDQEDLEEDFTLLNKMTELTTKLTCLHEELSGSINDLLTSINRQLSEHQLKNPPPQANSVELLATSMERVAHITVVFPSPDKRALWEAAITEAKQKLEAAVDGKDPEFLHALQITKTRAGMQFSCAAPIDSINVKQCRDVWVCNSDGYVGHMCLLSLQPEPIVTLNSPVPGCNSRILCICATPAFLKFKRKGSGGSRKFTGPRITVEEDDNEEEEEEDKDETEDGYVSDSSSTTSDDLSVIEEERDAEPCRSPSPEEYNGPQSPREQTSIQDPLKSTMWLGTEDGCIHIFPATENIKTTKKKIRLQQSAGVLCIVHLDQKVFVSLANGDLVVYQREQDGAWDITGAEVVSLGNATSPINKMLAVAGKLWCSCHNEIMVINPSSLELEVTFKASPDPKRGIFCMTCSGLGVWLAPQASSKVYLYHATTYDQLLEVSIAQAVAQKLQTADDIIRQHKTACLRITTVLACKDLLWVGTSAGVILTLAVPKISSTAIRNSFPQPTVTGLVRGHTGHVRFLTCVEMPPSTAGQTSSAETKHRLNRRSSITLHTLTMATKMIVISGGDGYEDFRSSTSDEAAGRDDSTNHLLLWQV